MSMSYNYPPEMAFPSAPPLYRSFPAPPRLHCGWVLALTYLTLGVFGSVWLVVQANWVKKVTRNSTPFWWCLAYLLWIPALYLLAFTVGIVGGLSHRLDIVQQFVHVAIPMFWFGLLVLYVVAAFSLKAALESEPIAIPLGSSMTFLFMTFLFAPIYFQYNLYDYSVEGKVGEQLSGFEEPVMADSAGIVTGVPEVPPQG